MRIAFCVSPALNNRYRILMKDSGNTSYKSDSVSSIEETGLKGFSRASYSIVCPMRGWQRKHITSSRFSLTFA